MFTQNQKKVVTGLGIGATALGTVLLARHHKKSSHQVSKKELLKKESETANRNRKRLHDYLNRHDKHSNSDQKYYGNGVHCDKHACHVDWGKSWSNIIRNSANNIISQGNYGWPDK